MLDIIGDNAFVVLTGLFGGVLLGLAARLGRFCTLGAIEDLLYGGSDIRMRMWVLAIGVAVMGTFGLTAAGWLIPEDSFYLSIRWTPSPRSSAGSCSAMAWRWRAIAASARSPGWAVATCAPS